MNEPTDAELDTVLCNKWPAFSMQATLVRVWVRAAMRDALAKWGMLRAEKIVIPTDTMEQEFQKHYQRGYAAGQKASATQPTKAQPVVHVWTPASTPPKEEDGEVLVRMADGRCEIAWATYWHGSSNAFAQWTFRDPDEDEQPVEWMHISKHCATAPHPTQAQAGAVPLTDEQIEALPMWKRFVGLWPETRREIVRIIESAHGIGIKGGQHGTE